jgi:FkbM family methyltransferase
MIDEIEIRDGWYWPKTDRSCWAFMLAYPDLPKEISTYVPKKDVVVQAGGNCGYYPKQYAKLFDTVYTFEPEWLNFHCLNLNVTERNVIKNQACLGDSHKLVNLAIKEKNRGKNYVNGNGILPTYCIDDLNLETCNLIHLDIEGYEFFALRGAVQTIKKCRPVVVVEMWDKLDNRFGENINHQTIEFLTKLNYTYIETLHDSDKIFQPNETIHNTIKE